MEENELLTEQEVLNALAVIEAENQRQTEELDMWLKMQEIKAAIELLGVITDVAIKAAKGFGKKRPLAPDVPPFSKN